MRIPLVCLALTSLLVTGARADQGEVFEPDEALYFGTGNHVKLGLDLGLMSAPNVSFFSLGPTVEGRFAIGEDFDIQVVVPMMFVSASPKEGDSRTRFELANPTIAFEAVLDKVTRGATLVRGGVALPLVSLPTITGFDGFGDVILQLSNISLNAGANGMFNLWRYLPDRLSIFGEIVGAVDYDGLFMEFGGGLGLMIPTSDSQGVETELAIQLSAKMGFGTVVIPYLGLGFVIVPTEFESGEDGGDAFQFGVEAGFIFKAGKARIDLAAQLNVDEPFGFSFDDGRVFGLRLSTTIPF